MATDAGNAAREGWMYAPVHAPALATAVLASTLVVPVAVTGFFMSAMAMDGQVQGSQLLGFGLVSCIVTLLHTFVLGLPAFFWLRRRRALSAGHVAGAGFGAGGVLTAVLTWPYQVSPTPGQGYETSWHGQQFMMVSDGQPTLFGWLSYLESVAITGALGLVSALGFWFCWVYFQRRARLHSARMFPS